MKEGKRLDSLKKIEDISKAIEDTKSSLGQATTIKNYFTITHVITLLAGIIITFLFIVLLRAFNVVTGVLTKDEIELRRLRKISKHKKEHKNESNSSQS